MRRNIIDGAHFRQFAASLEKEIGKLKDADIIEEDVVATQKRQVEQLAALEDEWREAVISHEMGKKAYQTFVDHIKEDRKNILAARPFFRERQPIFTKYISPALKAKTVDVTKLYPHHVNWTFIHFVMTALDWPKDSRVVTLAEEIADVRNALVVTNLPLAISRSRIFWSRTPQSHITFMDFVSIASEGLLTAIDKFELPYSDVWCSVAIGRMVGNFIKAYSETTLHFFPTDRRKLYRANKFLAKCAATKAEWTPADVVAAVNDFKTGKGRKKNEDDDGEDKRRSVTSEAEISNLLAAATSIKDTATVEVADESRPDLIYEMGESISVMKQAINTLPLLDKKILTLKGIR